MQFDELNREICEVCEERNWDQYHIPKRLPIGLSTELNELLELFRFKVKRTSRQCSLNPLNEPILKANSRVSFFNLRFADLCDANLEEALATKLETRSC